MNQFFSKIPKPLLVFVVLVLAIALFVYNEPLGDECKIQAKVFERNTKGILTGIKRNGKIQFAMLVAMRDRCREGNSVGACTDYFNALKKIATELKTFNDKCQIKYSLENESFIDNLSNALKIMSLVAWGERPPGSVAERAGWLTESQLKTFCAIKKSYLLLAGEEKYQSLRSQIYREYPDAWSESLLPNERSESDGRNPENRPKALKSIINPGGHFEKNQIYERSLFSLRCDLYL